MSGLATLALDRPLYPVLLALACLFGGWYGYEEVGRLEDPEFPIKNAYVITPYPGATALEVEQEVTDTIEAALQEMPQLYRLTSKSLNGRSEVMVELLEQYGKTDTPQIWDELRRRVQEATLRLPPGALQPLVEDDFGDVYGMVYAFTLGGHEVATVQRTAKDLSRLVKSVPGVGKVALAGLPREAVYLELSMDRLERLGVSPQTIFAAVGQENRVIGAGSVALGGRRLPVLPPTTYSSVDAIGALRIGGSGSTEIIPLDAVADIQRALVETPDELIRHNGDRVFTLSVSVTPGESVVKVGAAVDAMLAQAGPTIPLGMTMIGVSRQHVLVQDAVTQFLKNLSASVLTVIVTLCLFMGWRAGTLVGSVLLLTVLGTLGLMALLSIELQRISLGALMIAMGMLVDNAIVVAEGMVTGVARGLSPRQAGVAATERTQFPLLGATVIGILAFAPIGLADDDSGHFLRSLVQVVGLSLLLSWVLAVTLVPAFGARLLRSASETRGAPRGWAYEPYRRLVAGSLLRPWRVSLLIAAITGTCLWGFAYVKQAFFPTNNAPFLMVDYLLPEGTDIYRTLDSVEQLEAVLRDTRGIRDITSFVGRGTIRYAATIRPEQPNPAYAHLLVRVEDAALINDLLVSLGPPLRAVDPDAEVILRRNEFTPGGSSKVEARFSGPDPDVLRRLGRQALAVYLDLNLVDRKLDWRQRALDLKPRFNADQARLAGIDRVAAYQSVAFATEGVPVGLYRERDQLLPIIARAPADERLDLTRLAQRKIYSAGARSYVPMTAVFDDVALGAADSRILRRDRVRTLTAQANLPRGQNFVRAFERLRVPVEAIALPPGYTLSWGGEYESSLEAQTALGKAIPLTFGTMFLVTLLLFGKVRQTLVIWLTVPLTVCGVVVTLLATDTGFTFPAFLGFLSLAGMLIKNCVVLVDEIDKRTAEQQLDVATMTEACVSRLRPVLLATGTTIAGMAPLLGDAFFREMAICIMGGLAFATLLTLIAVPAFYRLLVRKGAVPASAGALAPSLDS
jgi:multidrug efflux pump subunit AcrB